MSSDTTRTLKWLSPVPGELRWPACNSLSLMTSRRTGLSATISFSRIACSIDIAHWPMLTFEDKPIYGRRATRPMHAMRSACASRSARSYSGAMKLDSKYFDMIRIRRPRAEERDAKHEWPCCQWKGCTEPGRHRAPVGRGRDGEFYAFCTEHIRRYNSSYNYFDGMTNAEVEKYLQGAV